jgi:YD repeat-containing protein
MSDRDKAGLRGPVKACADEIIPADGRKYSTTTEYGPDGRLLVMRGTSLDGSEWVTTQTYDAEGRLIKMVSHQADEPSTESLFTYAYSYDEQGRKIMTQSFDPETLKRAQRPAGYSGSLWDVAVRSGLGVPVGGNIITIYNSNDQPTEAQLRDSQGRIVTRIVRSYDQNGRIIEENQIQENPALMFADKFGSEGRPQPTAAQLEAMSKAMNQMMGGRSGTGTSYSYDAQGRVIEMHLHSSWFDKVTKTSYNERGDKKTEVETTAQNPTFPTGAFSMDENGTLVHDDRTAKPTKFPDEVFGETKVSYAYEYDSYGNWTQLTVSHKSGFGEASSTCNRKLKYY